MIITNELTIPFPEFFAFFSFDKLKKMFKKKTGNFRVVEREMETSVVNENKIYFVVQQRSSLMGWIDVNIIHTYLSCGKSRRVTVALSFDTEKEAEVEIDKIEKKLPSIVEKIFCGSELDRIVREVRDL